jgi:predicted nucleic acid-binding Zn ribbon protein
VSDLEPVGDGLAEVLRKLGFPSPDAAERLAAEWAEIAGEPWSERSRPAGMRDGVLVVEVSDGAAATLLKYRTTDLVERICAVLGRGTVTTVRIRVAGGKKGR